MSSPVDADYILENPQNCGLIDCATLPDFPAGNPTFFNIGLERGALYTDTGYSYYAQGSYFLDDMQNGPCNANCGYPPKSNILCGPSVTNVLTGPMDPSSSFSLTWETSKYTSYFTSGC